MRFVIVGGGVAGVTAAQRLYALASSAEIVILESEPFFYYLRPGLIDLLIGRASLADITPFDRIWYQRHGINYRLGEPVIAIEPKRSEVILASGNSIPYDRLLLAMGAQPRLPPIPGIRDRGVFTLRTAADSERIRTSAQGADSMVVIGGGWLGLEAAGALHESVSEITVLEGGPWPLSRQLDQEAGAVLIEILERLGIRIRPMTEAVEILGTPEVTKVRLANGEEIPAEIVLVAVGVVPRVFLAQEVGLAVGRGIQVDDFLQTSAPNVYAAGDVAEWRGKVYGIVPAAREQALVAAQNMVEPGSAKYAGTAPSQRLKVAGVDLLCLGDTQPQGGPLREVRKSDNGRYVKLVLDEEGRIKGAIVLGVAELASQVEEAFKAGAPAPSDLLTIPF